MQVQTENLALLQRLKNVQQRIETVALSCQRQRGEVQLLAVGKRHPAAYIRALASAGQIDFGENYLQEALEKIEALSELNLNWHFIGAIQSNKTRQIAEHFDWVHTVDRLKVAQRLSDQRPDNKPPLNICIQVNIDDEASKSGIDEAEVEDLATAISEMPKLCLRGLMAIPKKQDANNEGQAFHRMSALFQKLKATQHFTNFDTLSMGMSADLEEAVAQGATIVRIGTDIFGPRD